MGKKVLVLGSTGMAGHQIYNYFENYTDYDLYNMAYRSRLNRNTVLADARDIDSLLGIITNLRPDVIVNCIGVLVSESKTDPENAILINAYLPHRLKRLTDQLNSKLIHISTDCVFSGKDGQYTETSIKDGYDTYSKTKGLGEITEPPHLTLRTSIIGPELKSNGNALFHWFMTQKNSISGFKKSIWSGVTTLELAKAVKWAIDKDISGLYHITNGKPISKFDLLNLLKKETGKDFAIQPVDGKEVDKSFIDTRKLLNYEIPCYEVMIKEMVNSIRENRTFYEQYSVK